jgi:hypothetical protein
MCSFPSDLITEIDQTPGNTRDCDFAGARGGTHVKVDVTGQIEAAFNRSLDSSFQENQRHSSFYRRGNEFYRCPA